MATVLLFDIDGTLVSTGGAGRRAMVGAFTNLHARDDVFAKLSFAGMTDRAIVRHGLALVASGAVTEDAIDRLLAEYLRLLAEELPRSSGYRILPGVAALLERLRDEPDVAVASARAT